MNKKIIIDTNGTGFAEVLEAVEKLASGNGLDRKKQSQIRLLTEETMEMVRNLSDAFRAEVSATIDKGQFELKLYSESSMDSSKRQHMNEIVYGQGETREVSGKIRAVLESRYYDESEENEQLFEQMGIQKLKAGEIEDLEKDSQEEEYIWSLQNYGFKTFDNQINSSEGDLDWAEIGRSIIANLADDLRVYIFRDHLEMIVTRRLEESLEKHDEWPIDPELAGLKKVPVAKSRIQIRMVQLLYRGLKNKEKSNDALVVDQITIPCPESPSGELDCMIYTPRAKRYQMLPAVLLLHGGALVLPALPYHFRLARYIAEHTGSRVFMPLYDLAPDHKPPIQHKEAVSVYSYLKKNAKGLLIDPSRFALMGDSAGATLCAALCLILKNNGFPMPSGQVLLYPSLDARLTSRSMELYTDVPIVNSEAVKFYYKICASKSAEGGSQDRREYTSPVEAESLAGMPPTYVETAEFDCLHDDGILYADRLAKENCEVVLNETKGTVHAYDMAENSTVLKDSLEKRARFINELFEK